MPWGVGQPPDAPLRPEPYWRLNSRPLDVKLRNDLSAGTKLMNDVGAEDQERRLALLCEVYRVAVGNTKQGLGPSNLQDCARRALLSGRDGDHALRWLVEEGLVERSAVRGTIFITHAGVKEVEASFAHPDNDTAHFAASVIQTTSSHRN